MNARKRSRKTVPLLLVFSISLLLLHGIQAVAKDSPPRDQSEAMQWAENSLKAQRLTNITVNSQYILYTSGGYNFGIALARIGSISLSGGSDIASVSWRDYSHESSENIQWVAAFGGGHREAGKFKAALEFLAASAHQTESEKQAADFVQFQAQAQAWREAAVKPSMPETAHEHQVLAEYAFKEKDTDKAIHEYTAALDIDPCWPEGQFNLATLAGEKKLYSVAVFHMKEYVELLPESSDVQAAKDSIIIWKDKLQTLTITADNGGNGRSK
jgi:tetratricopeptide (TPR) repeat protein